MSKVKGVEPLKALLRKKYQKIQTEALKEVEVGYSALHALFVHEDLEAHHDQGQAKFLEQPLRQLKRQLQQGIYDDVKRGIPLGEANRRAGEKLLRPSQKLVPVDSGELRESGYVKIKRKGSK